MITYYVLTKNVKTDCVLSVSMKSSMKMALPVSHICVIRWHLLIQVEELGSRASLCFNSPFGCYGVNSMILC